MQRLLWMSAAACLALGCEPKEVRYEVSIISKVCEPSQEPPLTGVQYVQIRVSGPGLDTPLKAVSPVNGATKRLELPAIPAGRARVIEVRGYDAEPGSGRVLAIGRSLPQDIPEAVPAELAKAPIELNVFMRRVNTFTPISSAESPTRCERLKVGRAGHTATLLDDGRVFIAGGYSLVPGSGDRLSLADVEIFDPNLGTFRQPKQPRMELSSAAQPAQPQPLFKAFHTATKLKNGQVLLLGGEMYQPGTKLVAPNTVALLFDTTNESVEGRQLFSAVPSRRAPQPPNIARTRHAAILEETSGKVLVVGGMTRKDMAFVPAEEVEWYDPDKAQLLVLEGLKLPREAVSITPLTSRSGGPLLAVAGGSNGSTMATDIVYFAFNGSTFQQQLTSPVQKLGEPGRRAAPLMTLNDSDLLLIGGWSDTTSARPLSSTELIVGGTRVEGPQLDQPRAETCAVKLHDGSVFAVGGQTMDAPGAPLYSDSGSLLLKPSSTGGATVLGGPSMGVGRHHHSCTVLSDGSVLVLGGVSKSADGTERLLDDAWLYTPPPLD